MQHNYQKAQPKHVAHLIQLLSTIYPPGDALCEIMKGNMVTLTLKKDELLIAEGDTCHYMHFIFAPVTRYPLAFIVLYNREL